MLQIPQHALEKLKCSVCDGYLSSKPIMIKPESEQVCGKCFRIIPTEEKEKCLRQIGLEALAEVFIFPCRYNRQGCNYTFSWGNENNHEEECTYRYNATRLSIASSKNSYDSDYVSYKQVPKNEFNCESEEVKAKFSYEIKESKYSQEVRNLTYILNIQGNYGKALAIKNGSTSDLQNNINLSIEGAVSLRNKPEMVYSDIKVKPVVVENIYESVITNSTAEQHCFNCKAVVDGDIYHCLFGHVSCTNCKGNMCIMCVNLLEKESKTFCKNYHKGCREIFSQHNINKHQSNCQHNDIKCPLEACEFKSVLTDLKIHLNESHLEQIYLSSDVTKSFQGNDEIIVILCYESIFKCVYFYYKTFVEFFVTYIGSSEEAVKYTYEISVQPNGKSSTTTRRSKCSGWNDSMLEKGITFDKKDLVNSNNGRKLNFEVHLKILHVK